MRRVLPLVVLLTAVACHRPQGAPPTAHVASIREIGLIPDPPGAGGRDVGFSASFGGHSVWVFGDTFFAVPAADGYRWRASTWSWTDDADARGGLTGWTHALGADGKPLQLLPHTPGEQAFDDAHNGSPCPAGSDCGARHTAWPGAMVVDPLRGALVFYVRERTQLAGSFFDYGSSIAVWPSPTAPTVRSAVANGPDPTDPTLLFGSDEPAWAAAAALDGDMLYAYACPGGLSSPCRVARAPLASALDRAAWRFFNGHDWSADWRAGVAVLQGAPLMSVHFSAYLGKWVAYAMVPVSSAMSLSLADRPEGPWSDPELFGEGAAPQDGTWDYALFAHPEFARPGVEYLSYFQPGRFLDGTVHLIELTYR